MYNIRVVIYVSAGDNNLLLDLQILTQEKKS